MRSCCALCVLCERTKRQLSARVRAAPRGLKKPIEKLLNKGPLPLMLKGLSCKEYSFDVEVVAEGPPHTQTMHKHLRTLPMRS
jgi:hypothetical protein